MKKTFQRWLAMLLAVLMVMGTLPTSAWAARRDEEFAEQPVISDGDGVTDTLGRHDEGEFPVDPVDPSDPPADLNTAGFAENITVDSSVTSGVFATATKNSGTDDNFVIFIAPKFTLTKNASSETTKFITNGYTYFTGVLNKPLNNVTSYLDGAFSGMPFYWVRTENLEIANSLSIAWDGSVYPDGKTTAADKVSIQNTYGDIKQLQNLSDFWSAGQKFYVPGTDTEITGGTLPFEVFFHGTSGMGHGQLDLPITTRPLKVEILTKDAVAKTRFDYRKTSTNASYAAGEQMYSEVILTNTTDADMTVNVTIKRENLMDSEPANYGNNASIVDASDVKVADRLKTDLGYKVSTTTTGTTTLPLGQIYGLLGNVTDETKTDPNRKWDGTISSGVVPGGQNAKTQSTLSNIVIPANDSTTIYVAGTAEGATATTMKQGFNGVTVNTTGGAAVTNFWSSYMITATSVADAAVTNSDTAGIRWEANPISEPKVRLMHGSTNITPDDDTGTITDNEDSLQSSTGTKKHMVYVYDKAAIYLEWDSTNLYYALPAGSEVQVGINKPIYVDGVRTGLTTVADTTAITEVPMGTVTMKDDPDTGFFDETAGKDIYGHYMWDETAEAPTNGYKKVSYTYYPYNATVGVYANKNKFADWTGVSAKTVLTVKVDGVDTEMEKTGASATVAAAQVAITGDMEVTAHYMKPITLVTTYDGEAPGDNTVGGNPGNRDVDNEYVFSIEVRDALNNLVASYTKDGVDPTKITPQTVSNAWLLDLDAGKYRLYINGRPVGTQFDTTTIKEGATGYHFVVEMVGVTPKVANGTDKSGSTLTLTDDLNPARARGDVTVTGANKNTDGSIVLYYPKESSVKVTGAIAEGDTLSGLTYDGADKTVEVTDSTWGVKSVNNNMSVNIRGTKDLVVTFGAATGKVEVTFLKDTLAYVDATREVKLSTASNALENAVTLTAGTADSTKHIYTNDAVDPAKATDGVFYVFVGNTYVNETVTVTAGATDPATATVNYYTLTVEADQTKDAGAKVEQSTSAIAGDATKDSQTAVYLKNTVVNIKATESGTNYAFSTWEVQNNKGSAPDPNLASTSVTMTTETHLKAIFTKPKYDTYLKVTLNTNTNVTNDLVSATDTAKDFVSVTLGTGAGAITATHVGNGVWKAAGVVDATQKDLKWYVTTRAGGPFTANQSAVADRDDPTKFAEIKLYSVSTADTDYDTAQATMTATGVTGQTRVIVEKGAEITLSVTADTGYDHASPYWKEGTAGKGTVEKAKYTLTTELTAEQTLTPTFTYKATITPTVGTSDAVCDVDTVVLTAKNATNTDTTFGTPTEDATSHKWTVSGLPIGETEYAIWVNGHKSNLTVKNTTEQKVPMWTVSAATTTGGTVALTTTDKLSTTMPNGATYTTGWTITATANTDNGYRVADTAWALTSGNTYGTLAATNAASTTLSVTTAIEGNVVATAYFTQQWTVKSYVNTSGVTSTATLTDGTGTGADATHASTKTIDDTEYVKVDFNRSAGEELDGWTLAAGSGSWRATAPTETDNTWTDWATTAPAKTVESFYFKPSANSTITAAVKTKPYPVKIIVKLDDSDLTDKTATVPVVKVNNQTLTYSDGAWTGMFTPGDYALTVGSVINDTTQTLTNINFSVADGEGAEGGDPTNLTRTVKYWTVGVETDGHGAATMSSTNPVQSKTVNATTTSATIRVLESTKVTWADSTPVTNYVFEKWQEKQADDSYADATPTADGITAKHTYKALFKQKTGTVTVTVKLDGQKDDKSSDATADADLHTVNLYQVGAGDGGADKLIGTKTGKSGEYSFTGVPYNQGAGKYYITAEKKDAVTGAKLFTSAKNIEFSGDDGDTKTVDAPYFTLQVHTTQKVDSTTELAGRVAQSLSTITGTLTETDTSAVYAGGTTVNIKAANHDPRYEFNGWTVTKGSSPADTSKTGATTTVTLAATGTTGTILLAEFQKTQFNAYLDVKVNNIAHTDPDVQTNIKKIELVKSNTDATSLGTPVYKDGHWTVGPLNSTTVTAGQWKITTVDGGVYYEAMKTTEAVSEKLFYGVTVQNGDHGNTTNHAYVRADGTTRAVAPIGENVAIKANPDSGYTFSKWLADHAGNPTAVLNAAAEKVTAPSDGNFTFNAGYTTTDNKDIYLKPVYTYEVTVRTVRPKTGEPTTMEPTAPGGNVVVNGTTWAATSTGVYKVTGLTPGDTEYAINVNGFDSSVKIKVANAGGTVDVELFSVTMDKQTAVGSETIDGTAYIAFGEAATGTKTSLYLPEGAKTDDTHKVTVFAANAATNPKYRLKTETGEKPWTAATYVNAQSSATTTLKTPADGMAEDITIIADFLRQYDLTVSAVTTEDKAATNSEVKLTADPKGLGTVMPGTATGQSVKVTKVDAKTYIKAEYVHGVGEDFKGWSYAEANGDLYSALKEDGTVDTTKRIAPAALTAPGGKENTTVYFVPKTDGAVLKAVVEPAKYTVQVKVNLDNTDYPYNDGDLKVWLYTDEATPTKVTGLTYNTTDKAFKGEVYPGTYRVYVNGADLANDPVFTEAAKNISFTADEAEGTAAGGGAAGKAKLEKTINYYTVNLKADPAGTAPAQNKISFETITDAKPGATTASKIFLAKAAGYNINIYSKVYAGRGATDTVHYRFVDWTETATAHGFADKDAGNTAYKFPAENTLVADTANIDGAQEGKQLTLTANFKEQYKVTVKRGYNPSDSITPQVMVTGDTAANRWKTTVYVDVGGTVDLQTSGSISGLHFQSWTIAKKAAPNETEDDGKGKFQNEDNPAKYEAERGTKKASADNVTNPNNLNGFKPEDDTVIDLNLWKEPTLTDGLWTYERGVGKEDNPAGVKKFTWTVNDAKEITKVTVKGINTTSYAETELTKGTDYNLVDGKIVLLDGYIDDPNLVQGDYTITVTYTLGTTYNEVEGLTKETNFYIKQTPYTLTRVDIGVPTKTAAEDYTRQPDKTLTMNIDATDSKTAQAAYLESDDSHLHKNISKDDLTFTWFWAAKAPTQGAMTGTTLTNYNNGIYPAGWNKITDTNDFTTGFGKDADGHYNAVPTFTSNGTDYTDLKGNYVFAVVTATVSGEGTVITNAISVDYDAKITLRQDGTAVTDAKAGGYAVYLWPTTGGAFDVTSNKAVQATHVTGAANDGVDSGIYSTKGSKLNANTDYHIYVLETEGMTQNVTANYIQWKNGSTPVVISRTTTPPTYVDYYTVSVTDMTAGSTFTHATTAKQANDPAAAETFTSYPTFIVTTPKGATINNANNAKGVLKGTKVGVKANALAAPNNTVGWTQDYTLAWQDKEGAETDFTDAVSKLTQSSTTAVSTGYPYTNSLANKVDFTGRLTQNTYTIEGDVKDVDRQAGKITTGGGAIATATLTAAAATYNGTLTPTAGGHGAKVAFTVPRAAAEAYTLTATPTDGTSGTPETTMKGYSVPSATAATTENPVKLDEVAAGTTGNALKNRFTIFVAATELKMKVEDGDNTEGHHNESSNRDDYVSAGHAETWVYANYTAWEKTITVTNTGNTELAVTLVLQKSTDGGTNWTDIYKTGTELGGTGKDTDTNGVQFVGLEDTFNLGLADDNKSKSFKVKVPETLENKDDVKYRFDFVTKDGRGGADPVNGPKMYFNLDLTIEPVTIRRVTTWNNDGTFKVQHHWLKEDAVNLGQPDTDATYNAGGEAHTYAAETLGTGHTIMDDLVKQGDTLDDGSVATNDPTKSDIKYRWYVADADAEKPTINTTTGALTFPGNKGHEVTADVGSNGTAYTPTEADHGKMLYLVAVGQRNATNAVMTPDETRFAETPVPIPYPATITLWENKMGGSGEEREQVKEADKDKYTVYVWDTANGDFPVDDPTAEGSKVIPATPVVADGKCTYKTDVVLYPDHTYQVWTSAAKKADGAAFYLRNTGITIDSVDHKDKDVDYYLVDVANTTLSQNDYEGKLGTIADNSTIFYNANDLTGDLEKPSAKMPAKGETTATLDVVNNYVLKNTDVTLGYPARTLDYDLNWTGGYTNGGNPDAPGAAVTHVVNYSAATAQIKTELKLKVYDVVAWVTGSLGSVDKIAMTMNDGVVDRVFTTTGDVDNGEIAGLKDGETVPSISTTDQNKTFRLPKANYNTVATYDDSVYTLQCYKYPHNGADKGKENFVVPVTANTSYDVVLQGEGFSMQVADDVDVQTQKNTNSATGVTVSGVWSDSADPKRQDGSQTQTIKLNYNYNEDQKVKLTVTNASQQPKDETADRVILYDITFTADATAGNPIILSTDTGDTNSFAGGAMVDSLDDKGSATVTLKIPSGLDVGKYEYTAKFDFKTTDGGADGASATYKLVVEVEPLTFNSVDVKKDTDGTLIIDPAADKQYTVTRKVTAEDGETPNLIYRDLPNTTTTDPDTNGKLIQDTDYGYQWISAPVSMSYDDVKAAVSWSDGVLTVTEAANGVKKGSGADATQKVYTPKDADSGRSLFLVIYGKDNANGTRRNATSFAISPAQVNTYKGMVALKVDDAEKRGKDDADSADVVNKPNDGDGYEVWFISKDNAMVKKQATWTKVGTEYAYVADLIPNENGYSVEISRAKDSDKKVALPDALITGANVKTTIDTTGSNVVEAPFFTVNAVNFINEEYKTGTGETFTATITPIITIGADHAELANHTPVLSGQSVAAKAPAMADPNGDKAWEQDYTLTWRNTTGNDKNITVDDKTNLTDETNNAYKGQSATAAIADGAYAYGAVSAKTFIGGRLDQTTYTIVGTIHGPTGNAQQVKKVSLKETTSNVTYWNEDATDTGIKSGKWKDSNNDGKHNNGDEVTFTVVKGTYTVTGYEDTNFTIRKVTVEGTDAASTPRNEKTFTQSVEKLTEAKRIFDIYLEATGPKLMVNDTENPANEAASTPTDDHKFADNDDGAHYYYKQLTADDVFTLELSNPGNVDLKLKAPEVYKLDTGTDYSNMQTALSGKTALTNLTVKDGTRTILTFAGLPAANDDVLVGERVSHDGNTLTNAGTITVSKDVYNKDDAIYVVKFASEYLTTDGAPAVTGPTVYYVLDLKVEPLPIKKVTAETDPTKTDGTLRLKDNDLDSVLVDHDLSDATDPIGAKAAGLAEGDISYVWYSAPTSATVVAGDFDFDTTGMKLTAQGTAKGLKQGENANNGKTYKPSDAEQGLNFYLVAYRTDADKNASEFAVSDGVYAQVTIAMKAYRTDKAAPGLLTDVNISTMVGEDKKTSNDDTVTVTGVADNANVLTFNATKTDVTAQDKADDPAAAKWYFKSWAVQPLTGDELGATDTGIETPVAGERLTMNYTATGKATVIGYFDKLPELSYKNGALAGGYVIGNDADEVENDRTLTYTHNDGSGSRKVRVFIAPANDGKSVFGGTWASKTSQELTFGYFDKVAGAATGSSTELGVDGDYVLSREQLIKPYLKSGSTYVITFYDMEKGAKAENGYEGYDRSVTLTITAGNFDVTARAKDANETIDGNQGGVVRLYTTKPADDSGFVKEDKKTTSGGFIQAEAKAEPGYRFVEWKVLTHDDDDAVGNGGTMTPANGKSLVVSFSPDGEGAILEASFEKVPFTPQADVKTSVYYGDDELQETDGKLVVSVTKDKDAVQNFAYDLATEAELTDYLNGATRPANAYTKDGVGDGTNNTNVVPAWLHYEADATDNTKVNFTVKANTPATGVNVQKKTVDGELKDVEDELVVYLKVTETNTNESKIVPVAIDVVTSQLKIATAGTAADDTTLDGKTQQVFDGDAYLALFEAAIDAAYPGEGRKPDHEEKVYYDYFAYTNVYNENNPTGNIVDANNQTGDHAANAAGKNRWDKTDGAANTDYGKVTDGYWTVAPAAFDGTGPNGYVAGEEKTNAHDYVFTFHYTGAETAEDDYNYENASITLTIPALVPEMSLKFADTLHTTTKDGDPKTLLTLTKGTHSGEVAADGYVKNDAVNYAPISLAYANAANRTDEHLTYLDEEPVFHVTLQKIGNLKRVELSAADVDGFKTDLPTFTIDPNETTQTASFDVKLAALKSNPKLWVGTHTIKISAKGYYDDATGAEKYIEATYELSVIVDPKVIATVDVKVTDPETEPTEAKGTTEDGDPVDNKTPDSKGNVPIKDVDVTWKPEPGTPDGKHTEAEVKVEIDPNYVYAEDDPATADNNEDITNKTELTVTDHLTPDPEVNRDPDDGDHVIHITQKIPYLMHDDVKDGSAPADTTGPKVDDRRTVSVMQGASGLGSYTINLGAYGANVYDVKWTVEQDTITANAENGIGAVLGTLPTDFALDVDGAKQSVVLDLSAVDTSKTGTYTLTLLALGKANADDPDDARTIQSTYVFRLIINSPGGGGGVVETCPCKVFYHVGLHGTTTDATVEDVSEGNRPSKVPTVTALDGYAFRGWSLTNPATLKKGEKITLVDPKTVTAKGESMTFYAVIVERPFHEHYVIGYPNGNFGPADNINRASVATIIARAILPDFVEGANYGNPGGYSDVSGHWAESAIAYCSKFDVFKGYTDGTFRPDQPITRQEFATVIARLDGELTAKDIPFNDIDEAGDWALNGIYTSYEKGWVNGYTDGTFKPLNNIRRDEAVKVFNAYLNRGVDADGLADLREYVHTGAASNNTENGVDEYMTWPDVPKGHWAYYEIVEAANDHEFTPDFDTELGYTLPEHWEKCWIDERWRYGDGPSGGDSAAMVSAGFQVWLH